MTDTTLESIFSGRSEPVSETETVVETPVAEVEAPEPEGAATEPEAPSGSAETAMVPKAALDEARAKARKYTDTVASFEQKLEEQNAAWQRRFDELVGRLQQPQTQQQPQHEQAPDFWENPEAVVQALVQQAISPVVQHVTYQTEQASQREAVRTHGQETVEAAFRAMEERIKIDPVTQAEHRRIMASGDPWGNLVQWYDKQPERLETRIREQVLKEIQEQGHLPVPPQQQAAAAPAVMPSDLADARSAASRSGPAYGGPPTLKDIFKR